MSIPALRAEFQKLQARPGPNGEADFHWYPSARADLLLALLDIATEAEASGAARFRPLLDELETAVDRQQARDFDEPSPTFGSGVTR